MSMFLGVCLQISMGFQAFLSRPEADSMVFIERWQVIDTFSIDTTVDHCVEPSAYDATYRQVFPKCPCLYLGLIFKLECFPSRCSSQI